MEEGRPGDFSIVSGLLDDEWTCSIHRDVLRLGQGCPHCNAQIAFVAEAARASAEQRRQQPERSGVEEAPPEKRFVHSRLVAAGIILLIMVAGAIWRFWH